jgi:hypothetical protein
VTGYRKTIISEEARLRKELAAGYGEGVVDWRIQFAEAFANKRGGFDMVLANPPYVRQELIKDIKPALKAAFPDTYCGTADLFCYFYVRAVQLLRQGGMLVFISSNKWFRASYGKKLRKLIADTCEVRSITDFGDLPVFQSAVAYPSIFVGQKSAKPSFPLFTLVTTLDSPYPHVLALIQRDGHALPEQAIAGSDWMLNDANTADLVHRMEKVGTPLAEYADIQIYRGLLTGLNDAFIIDSALRKELIRNDARSEEIIKPLAMGRDVGKWHVDTGKRWLIVTPIGIEIQKYRAVFDHLKQWKKELEERWDKGNHWWELRACDYYDVFSKPTILYQEIATHQGFAFDDTGVFINNKVFMIPTDDLFLLGVLNSQICWQYLNGISSKLQRGALALQTPYVKKIPVPPVSDVERRAIEKLVRRCLDSHGDGCEVSEQEIDERVGALYRL